jgi:hypothetical protein
VPDALGVVWCGRCTSCGATWIQPTEPPAACPDVGCGQQIDKWRAGLDPEPPRRWAAKPIEIFPGAQGADP